MYCKNCGNGLMPQASFCTYCGTQAGAGNNYCPSCCARTSPEASMCVNCGTVLNPQPQQTPPQQTYYQQSYSSYPVYREPRSKIAAGLFGIFLGAIGVHNFYLGYTGKAIAQLLITILSCGTLSFVSAIWGLVEGILILTGTIATDAEGYSLRD